MTEIYETHSLLVFLSLRDGSVFHFRRAHIGPPYFYGPTRLTDMIKAARGGAVCALCRRSLVLPENCVPGPQNLHHFSPTAKEQSS